MVTQIHIKKTKCPVKGDKPKRYQRSSPFRHFPRCSASVPSSRRAVGRISGCESSAGSVLGAPKAPCCGGNAVFWAKKKLQEKELGGRFFRGGHGVMQKMMQPSPSHNLAPLKWREFCEIKRESLFHKTELLACTCCARSSPPPNVGQTLGQKTSNRRWILMTFLCSFFGMTPFSSMAQEHAMPC